MRLHWGSVGLLWGSWVLRGGSWGLLVNSSVLLGSSFGASGGTLGEVFHRLAWFDEILPAHETLRVPNAEPEQHEMCPKSFVCRADCLEKRD